MVNGGPGQQRRGPNHPEVVSLTKEIEEARRQLDSTAQRSLGGQEKGKNPVYQTALEGLLSAKVDAVAGDATRIGAAKEVEAVRSEMKSLPEQQAKMAELDTNARSATDTYALLKQKLDEAKLKEGQANHEVELKTIDPAYVIPAGNKSLVKLFLAMALGPLLGIGTALLLNYTDNSVRTAADAEALLGLPVLTAIPHTRAHSLARQRCPEIIDVAYQTLSSNLWVAGQNRQFNAVSLISAEPDTGRSVLASNLAVTLAREGAA